MRKINPSLRLKINSDFSNEESLKNQAKKSLQKSSKNLEKNSAKKNKKTKWSRYKNL